MPVSAQMSLWGLYQIDNTILDGMVLPDGMNDDVVKTNLLLETESMEILYPNTDFLKAAVSVWSAERKEVWDKLYATTQLSYNPIENYDRLESGVNTGNSNNSGSNTSTNSSTAYNSGELRTTAKNESDGSNNSNSTATFSSRTHGNIGVTTTQQMIEQERQSVQFCMTQFIIDDFISRFCVGVY